LDAVHFRLFPNLAGGKMTVSAVMVNDQMVEPVSESSGGAVRLPLNRPATWRAAGIDMDFNVEIPRSWGDYGLLGKSDDI